MDLFKCLFLVLILHYVSTEPHHDHEDEDAFHTIVETINSNSGNDNLTLKDVDSILTMLRIRNCSNVTQHKCVTARSLFMIFNISTTLAIGEESFSRFAPIIVYALLPSDDHDDDHHDEHGDEHGDDHDDDHHEDENQITQNVNVYQEFLKRYETGVLCEQIFDQLLTDVNRTTGQILPAGSECFSSDDVFHELNISTDVGKSLLPEISMIIISKLLQKQCIKVRYQTPLPCSSHFANELFSEYAENGTISEAKMKALLEKLKIGAKNAKTIESTDDHDHDHDHRRRRSLTVPENLLQSQIQEKPLGLHRRHRRETNDHNHNHGNETKKYQKCYSLDEFFAIYQVEKNKGFTREEFQSLSSALLQQIESDACKEESHNEQSSDGDVAAKDKWGYGFLAVAIISLCSVAGVAIIPVMNSLFYQKTIIFFISLAVGTLVGDALLHLFPHALGFHANHDHGHGSESSHESEDRDYLWKFVVATAAIYGFFLFETLTHLFLRKSIGHSHSVEHTRRHSQFADHGHGHEHNVTELSAAEAGHQASIKPVVLTNMAYSNDESLGGNQNGAWHTTKNEKSNQGYSSQIREKDKVKKKISSVAWNIIIGDTIHNVADGIAIGVAFSNSISVGVSTAIAVFCHELPHELGDFAVLLSAGMSVKKALLANFLSACSCFLGLVFGILISEIEDVNLWIFAATGGFFIYIALTNMLPELMHSGDFNAVSKFSRFFLQNAGILTGFAIMFLLSYFEEDINV